MSATASVIASLDELDASLFEDKADRVRVRDALYGALRRFQTPWNIGWDHVVTANGGTAAIKALIDAGVFEKWAEAGGGPMTCAEIAKLVDADELLIRRLMRCVAGQFLLTETDLDTYARTPWAEALGDDHALRAWYGGFYTELVNPLLRSLPGFLKASGYRNPTDHDDCNFQFWKGPGATFFGHVASNPLLTTDFNDAMEGNSRGNLTDWPDVYPTDQLLEGLKPDRAVVVDVGGGKGHDLIKFHVKHPQIPTSRLVLQDLPGILKDVPGDYKLETREYDFFTPQPVTGARAYFMHGVLHDWPDVKTVEILRVVAAAMEKGYSKLLVHENMVNERGAVARVTSLDMLMMAGLAAAERTEGQWADVITGAGLRIVKIWRGMDRGECIIEAELA
ncbi:O-methyltransferase [Colletotrichum trifolii]|uniref:O-methyltransferase n=1 Tax=Colletotrichum trifolii TaxID=5466 RepID=A0A4R8Q9R5_COLTR|nr:O-methyltransferase [Colletotrichum trifolii]